MDAKDVLVSSRFSSADLETFKRPNHTDFMTAVELKKDGFSGLRHNSVADGMEIWVEGERKVFLSGNDMAANPFLLERAMEEVFALNHVEIK